MTDQPAEWVEPKLDGLASLLPAFEAPDFSCGSREGGEEKEPGVFTMPWYSYSDTLQRFHDVAYRDGWVLPGFDWPVWKDTPEARRLGSDRRAIEEATALDLARLLTVVIHQARFVENTLGRACESGFLTAVLRRVEQLRHEG